MAGQKFITKIGNLPGPNDFITIAELLLRVDCIVHTEQILNLGCPNITKKWPNRQNFCIRDPTDPPEQKLSWSAPNICAKFKYLLFKTNAVKKYWEIRARQLFEKKIWKKKLFGVSEIPPKQKNGKKYLISEIVRNHSHDYIKPLLR